MKTVHNYAFDQHTSFLQNTFPLANGTPGTGTGELSSTYGSIFAIQARRYGATKFLNLHATDLSNSLTAQREVTFNSSSSGGTDDSGHNSTHTPLHAGAIAGGVLGGVLFTVLLCLFWKRRRNKLRQKPKIDSYKLAVSPYPLKSNGAEMAFADHRLEPQRNAQAANVLQPRANVQRGELHTQIDQLRDDVQRMIYSYDLPPEYASEA